MLWNCIDDHEGPRTRAQLLSDYPELLSRIVFLRGHSDEVIKTLGLSRINFAFLDATHTEPEVRPEFEFVSARQASGDVVVLDDVTPSRSEEHTSELQSLMRISYAVFCFIKKKKNRYSPHANIN